MEPPKKRARQGAPSNPPAPPHPPSRPDPPATCLVRTLLGDATPPEPSETSYKKLVGWWGAVCAAVRQRRAAYVEDTLDPLQLRALSEVSKNIKYASATAIHGLYGRFQVRARMPVGPTWLDNGTTI